MKIGNKEIPFFRLANTLLGDLKTAYEKFGRDEKSPEQLAQAWGHKSAKSGTYLFKVATMRSYGLMDGRGKLAVTDLGERITRKKNDAEYQNALVQSLTRIPLWSILYEKYTKQNKPLSVDDLILELPDLCGVKIEEARNLAPDILKAYNEDTKLINTSMLQDNGMSIQLEQPPTGLGSQKLQSPAPKRDNLEPIGYGEFQVYLPKEPEEQKQVWKKLKAMVDAYINPPDDPQ